MGVYAGVSDTEIFETHFPVNRINGKNIFHTTAPESIGYKLWGCSLSDREKIWAEECLKTYKRLLKMPTPVSSTQMAKKWNCTTPTARQLIKSDWEWIQITQKRYVHTSQMRPYTRIHKACMNSKHPQSCFIAVNILREYNSMPIKSEIIKYMGRSYFEILKTSGILKSQRQFTTKTRIYYIPSTWIV